MKKKIGFVNFDMSTRGGAQQVLYNMTHALLDEAPEYDITIISLIQENEKCAYPLDERVHYRKILERKGRIREVLTKGGKEFRTFCTEQGMELLFYVGAYAGLCGGWLGRKLNIPKVFCDHGALLNQWNELPARLMRLVGSRYSDKTVVLTKQSEAAYYDKFSYEPGRVVTIYNWIDDVILEKVSEYDASSRRILTAGRFSREKGMDLLVETAEALLGKTTDFVWDVYGDGDLFPQIAEQIRLRGLQDHVKLMGLTEHMETCYQGHCMYVLTSYREGLPLVLIEAKANHLPLVSFDIVSGPAEIVSDGDDGILVPPYDTEQMAEEIYRLLNDPERRKEMSCRSGQNTEPFAKEKIMSQWRALIRELV